MCTIDKRPFRIAEHVANHVRDDSYILGILKLFVTGAIDPFKTLDRRTHPRIAVQQGHLDIVKWLFPLLTDENDYATREWMFSDALNANNEDIMVWLADNGCPILGVDSIRLVARGARDILGKLIVNGNMYLFCNLCATAAQNNDICTLGWLRSVGCPWDFTTFECAADYGSSECLEYAFENGCPRSLFTCTTAAGRGHLNCLMIAHENGCPCDEETFAEAAFVGSLECLQYLHSIECDMNAYACYSASYKGHLECLRYLHSIGCPWGGTNVCYNAATQGHLKCLEFAIQNGCPYYAEQIIHKISSSENISDEVGLCLAFVLNL